MYLLECVFFVITCAFRWGVTHIENFHYWTLLTLSRDHYFGTGSVEEGGAH